MELLFLDRRAQGKSKTLDGGQDLLEGCGQLSPGGPPGGPVLEIGQVC